LVIFYWGEKLKFSIILLSPQLLFFWLTPFKHVFPLSTKTSEGQVCAVQSQMKYNLSTGKTAIIPAKYTFNGKKRKRNKQSKVDQKTSSESEVAKAMETGAEMKSVKKKARQRSF